MDREKTPPREKDFDRRICSLSPRALLSPPNPPQNRLLPLLIRCSARSPLSILPTPQQEVMQLSRAPSSTSACGLHSADGLRSGRHTPEVGCDEVEGRRSRWLRTARHIDEEGAHNHLHDSGEAARRTRQEEGRACRGRENSLGYDHNSREETAGGHNDEGCSHAVDPRDSDNIH